MLRGQELREAYASADIFMMPSESETLGFVVLEVHADTAPVGCLFKKIGSNFYCD